jgi:oleandomycin transport system ATP-binding protein
MSDDAIVVEGLQKSYGSVRALCGVDFAAPGGSVLGLLGPNGAGKTTAVRILATLLNPDGGSARVAGHDVVREAAKLRAKIGLAGQYAAVDENLTGFENLEMVGRLYHMRPAEARARADELLERFDLSEAAKRPAKTYSGGMRRRLDLAASLVGRPEVLFLDEPTTGLDPRSRGGLWDLVRQLVGDGVTVLLTTQYLDEADQLADDIAVIDHGRVIATGTPDELKTKVGGQTLEVRPADAGDADKVLAAVAEVTSVQPESIEGRVTAPVSDPAMLPAVVRRLDEAGILISELSLHKSSLDEVFLSLTGHRPDEADATGDSTGEANGAAGDIPTDRARTRVEEGTAV